MKIQIEIQNCMQCPHYEETRRWTEDSWETAFDMHCKKANKRIAGYVDWYEQKNILVPEWCPCKMPEIKKKK